MGRRKNHFNEVELLEEQIGLLLEKSLDLAVASPPYGQNAHLKHLAMIRDSAANAATLADATIVLLTLGLAKR